MHSDKARELLKKHVEGTLTEEEKAVLESWYLNEARQQDLPSDLENIEEYLDESHEGKVNRNAFRWVAIAASVLLVMALSFYKWTSTETSQIAEKALENDALPGDFRAQLTLANGENILLGTARNGKLAQEGSTSIIKTKEGEITYASGTQNKDSESVFNTIRTPKSGQFQIVLSDGSVVWLNAESSIRFPAAFSPEERLVEVTGEVYFEVNKAYNLGKRIPFRVMSGNQTVEVLGTRFNINSYGDEGVIKTTLLEGSIQVNANVRKDKGIVLRPGQQAQLSSRQALKVSEVNTSQVMAWKEGYFRFDGIGIKELMQHVSRWYDMEIEYQGEVGEHEFVGEISRNTRLSSVLKILEAGGIKFRVEGKKIIVTE
jgi:transmembrane sensor